MSRGESILIPRLEGEGPEGRIDVQPEFRRSLMEAGGTGANFRPRLGSAGLREGPRRELGR